MECKYTCYIIAFLTFHELIDTLWNVNKSVLPISSTLKGINRYIMECKYSRNECMIVRLLELIDTLWNVNAVTEAMPDISVIRINRYIMECKSLSWTEIWTWTQ